MALALRPTFFGLGLTARSLSLAVPGSGPQKCSIQLQYKNYFLIGPIVVVLHLCGPLQYNAAIQVFYNLQKTCRLLAAAVKKTFIAVVLRLCGPLLLSGVASMEQMEQLLPPERQGPLM